MAHPLTRGKTSVLMGATGLVGSNLARRAPFSALVNSKTASAIHDARADILVCAAAPGSMAEANRDPDLDARRIDAICHTLARVEVDFVVLVSTIAVLEDFGRGEDEETQRYETALAYGRNRRRLEIFCRERFARCLVVRLPALYGRGLKKNFLFDLLEPAPSFLSPDRFAAILEVAPEGVRRVLDTHYGLDATRGIHVLDRERFSRAPERAMVESFLIEAGADATRFTNCGSTFQYYGLDRLADDLVRAIDDGLDLLHLATEPLEAGSIAERLRGCRLGSPSARLHHEDLRTRHAALWGRSDGYLESADSVVSRIETFFADEIARRGETSVRT